MFSGGFEFVIKHPWCCVVHFQVFQEEMGVVKSYNLKPGGDRIAVTKQNRKGESAQTEIIW